MLGTINPAAEIARVAKAHGATVLLDASQSAAHMPLDVRALGADFVAFTAHKMLGPTGIGALWGRREILEAMPPFLGGGEMIREVHPSSKWNELPWKFEAGTMAIAEAVGWGAAIQYLEGLGMDAVFAHDRELVAYALERLADVPGLRCSVRARRTAASSWRSRWTASTRTTSRPCSTSTACVRAKHHCAMPLHDQLGIAASARVVPLLLAARDVDALVAGLHETHRVFARKGAS